MTYKKMLVPLDGSDLAECVLPHVETITKGCEVPDVRLVQFVEPIPVSGGADFRISDNDRKNLKWTTGKQQPVTWQK